MSYQVLARKWRPKTFTDIIGQEHILAVLTHSLLSNKIHHAYLLSGTRGVGKTTIARLLTKSLNCESGITIQPCGQCINCIEITQGNCVDLIEIDAASRTKVEDIRELLNNIQYLPTRSRFKVYLIDEIHMLSRHSFNALLKTIEEPPKYIKFLLATTDPQKLPITILSRCLHLHLKALNIAQICKKLIEILHHEKISTEPESIKLLAHAANGSMRDVLSLTEHAIALGQGVISVDIVKMMLGIINIDQPLKLLELIACSDGKGILKVIDHCATICSIDWDSLLIEMLSLLHHIAMEQLLQTDTFNNEKNYSTLIRLQNLSKYFSSSDLQSYYQILLLGRKELHYAPDPRMGVEMILLRTLSVKISKK